MPRAVRSSFTHYELTIQEAQNGQILTTDNIYVIQNMMCMLAESRLNLDFDPARPAEFMQKEAAIKGSINTLQILIDNSASMRAEIARSQQEQE